MMVEVVRRRQKGESLTSTRVINGLWEEINQPLVGWNKFPLRTIRFEKEKNTRWKEFPSGKVESYSK